MTAQSEAFAQARNELAIEANRLRDRIAPLRLLLTAGRVPVKDQSFVESLLRASDRGLSMKQVEWVNKLVDRFTQPVVETPKVRLNDVKGVIDLLNRAKEHGLQFPKLWFKLFGDAVEKTEDVRITVAGERSKTPGYLTLTNGEGYGSPLNKYWGKISPAGDFLIAPAGEVVRDRLVDLLNRLAEDPAKVAAEFGHLTGHCCFCSKQLTDERSTQVGYGRTCAEKFGMPWGEK